MFRLRLRVRYHHQAIPRGVLALVLLLALLLVALTASRVRATAPASPAALSVTTLGVRQYYLSRSYVQASQALAACAPGYHFASIWEITDPSSLRYNTTLGLPSPDSGEGPPTAISLLGSPFATRGWIRTGYASSTSGTIGWANCGAWSSADSSHWGSVANLPSDWTAGEQDIGVWNTEVRTCDTYNWVWCVQDDSVWRVFLPLVLR
jgi:hypothetical protein